MLFVFIYLFIFILKTIYLFMLPLARFQPEKALARLGRNEEETR